jgi:DNA mismatch endonuclease (patch repair protein)
MPGRREATTRARIVLNKALKSGSMTSTWSTTAQIAYRMSRQARRDTRPEVAIRSMLHAAGQRFRVAYPVPDLTRCTIDIAFPRRRLAVFVDGCFWHDCPEHGSRPKTNADRWAAKLEANRTRDRRVETHLAERGWIVLRVWEHEDVASVCTKIMDCVSGIDAVAGS